MKKKGASLVLLRIFLFILLFAVDLNSDVVKSEKTGVTLVSAFLTNINRRSDRDIENYVECSQHLLNCNIPKVIFIESNIYDLYYQENDIKELYPQTTFVYIERDSLWLNSYQDQITHFNIYTDNPIKDTLPYMFVQCNKTEWVNQAIDLNVYDTGQYVWIDFGSYYLFNDPKVFENSLYSLQQEGKSYKNIRIGGCWNLKQTPESIGLDIYKSIAWYFAGTVFGGYKDDLVVFNQLVKEKCIETISQQKSLMWEVNIWYLIYLENKHLFSTYSCGHDSSLLNNY